MAALAIAIGIVREFSFAWPNVNSAWFLGKQFHKISERERERERERTAVHEKI